MAKRALRIVIAFGFIMAIAIIAEMGLTLFILRSIVGQGFRYAITDTYSDSVCGQKETLEFAIELLKTRNLQIARDELIAWDMADGEINCTSSGTDQEEVGQALATSARYYSILQEIRIATPNFIDLNRLQVSICSDTPGYTYDKNEGGCSPHNYPGRSGDSLYVDIRYRYQIGGVFNFNLGTVPIRVSRKGRIECHLLGCANTLDITFNGNVPKTYTLEISDMETGEKLKIKYPTTCGEKIGETKAVFINCIGKRSQIIISGFAPAKAIIIFHGSGADITTIIQPNYKEIRPNGGNCLPVCRIGTTLIRIP